MFEEGFVISLKRENIAFMLSMMYIFSSDIVSSNTRDDKPRPFVTISDSVKRNEQS